MASDIFQAVVLGDLAALARLLAAGADPNTTDDGGEDLLSIAISSSLDGIDPLPTVRMLLDAGANPDGDGVCGPMVDAIFSMRPDVLELLLQHDANPCAIVEGGDTIYELAECDYVYRHFHLALPEEPTDDDRADSESWLRMLDRLAVRCGKRPPVELHILRAHGALTLSELTAARGVRDPPPPGSS
ncbi:MAG: Ankyrin repeat protein [Ramlibacter sp.]|nr:Ankyrin repeat protein [Ramlibacter sp.]